MRHQSRQTGAGLDETHHDGSSADDGDTTMAKYRDDLPQRRGGIFLTDGGMETTLIFHEGVELPHFAAFVLLDSAGRPRRAEAVLRSLSRDRARARHRLRARQPDLARQSRLGRQARLRRRGAQDDQCRIDRIPGRLARQMGKAGRAVRHQRRHRPRGDGYKAGNMDAAEAEAYHARADCRVRRRRRRHGDGLYAEHHQRGDRHRACGQGHGIPA